GVVGRAGVLRAAQVWANLGAAVDGAQLDQRDQARPLRAGALQAGGAAPRRADREAVEAQGSADAVPDVGLVVDDEHVRRDVVGHGNLLGALVPRRPLP